MIHNSREALKLRGSSKADDKPSSSSRGRGLILETPYRPGFVDDKDLETVKMAVDKELDDISNAFYETTERTADTITRVDKLEITGETQYGELVAKIETVDKVSKEGDVALAERITSFEATANNEFGEVRAAITETNRVMASEDKLLAERIDSIQGAFEGDLGALLVEIDEVRRISIDGDSALAESLNNTKVSLEGEDAKLQANIKLEETARVTGDEAVSKRVDELRADMTTADANISAAITAEQQARVTADEALASSVETVRAEYKAGDVTLSGEIQNEATVRANQDGVLAGTIQTVKSELDGNIANVKQYAETNINATNGVVAGINAKWGVELDVNGKISGVIMNNNGARSNFEVRADLFRFTDTSGGTSGGFVSSGGQTYFSGDISASTGTFSGGLNITDQAGNVGMKISNSQILIYDEHQRLRVILGRL